MSLSPYEITEATHLSVSLRLRGWRAAVRNRCRPLGNVRSSTSQSGSLPIQVSLAVTPLWRRASFRAWKCGRTLYSFNVPGLHVLARTLYSDTPSTSRTSPMSRVLRIALGAFGPARTNAARHCTTSSTLCIKSINNRGANNIATIGVFSSTEDAEAVSRFVLDLSLIHI